MADSVSKHPLPDLHCNCVRLLFSVEKGSPIPVYCVAAFGFIRSSIMYFQMIQLETEFAFILRTIWLAAIAGYMGLVAYQAYALEKKWRLAVK